MAHGPGPGPALQEPGPGKACRERAAATALPKNTPQAQRAKAYKPGESGRESSQLEGRQGRTWKCSRRNFVAVRGPGAKARTPKEAARELGEAEGEDGQFRDRHNPEGGADKGESSQRWGCRGRKRRWKKNLAAKPGRQKHYGLLRLSVGGRTNLQFLTFLRLGQNVTPLQDAKL